MCSQWATVSLSTLAFTSHCYIGNSVSLKNIQQRAPLNCNKRQMVKESQHADWYRCSQILFMCVEVLFLLHLIHVCPPVLPQQLTFSVSPLQHAPNVEKAESCCVFY